MSSGRRLGSLKADLPASRTFALAPVAGKADGLGGYKTVDGAKQPLGYKSNKKQDQSGGANSSSINQETAQLHEGALCQTKPTASAQQASPSELFLHTTLQSRHQLLSPQTVPYLLYTSIKAQLPACSVEQPCALPGILYPAVARALDKQQHLLQVGLEQHQGLPAAAQPTGASRATPTVSVGNGDAFPTAVAIRAEGSSPSNQHTNKPRCEQRRCLHRVNHERILSMLSLHQPPAAPRQQVKPLHDSYAFGAQADQQSDLQLPDPERSKEAGSHKRRQEAPTAGAPVVMTKRRYKERYCQPAYWELSHAVAGDTHGQRWAAAQGVGSSCPEIILGADAEGGSVVKAASTQAEQAPWPLPELATALTAYSPPTEMQGSSAGMLIKEEADMEYMGTELRSDGWHARCQVPGTTASLIAGPFATAREAAAVHDKLWLELSGPDSDATSLQLNFQGITYSDDELQDSLFLASDYEGSLFRVQKCIKGGQIAYKGLFVFGGSTHSFFSSVNKGLAVVLMDCMCAYLGVPICHLPERLFTEAVVKKGFSMLDDRRQKSTAALRHWMQQAIRGVAR